MPNPLILNVARQIGSRAARRTIRSRFEDLARRELRRQFEEAKNPTDLERALGGIDIPDQVDSLGDLPF